MRNSHPSYSKPQQIPPKGYGEGVVSRSKSNKTRKVEYKSPPSRGNDNGVFTGDFVNAMGVASRFIGQLTAGGILLAMAISGALVDVFAGTLSLALTFVYDFPWNNMMINSDLIALFISVITSGIQIFLYIMWGRKGNLTKGQWLVMGSLIVMDTIGDTASIAWFTHQQTPLTITLADKPAMFWLFAIMYGGVCMVSENVIMLMAGMGTGSMTIGDIFKKIRGR